MKVEVEVTVDGVEYTAKIDGGKVVISAGGVWAGNGRWNGHQIEDCGADLGDAVYEALDAVIRGVIGDGQAVRYFVRLYSETNDFDERTVEVEVAEGDDLETEVRDAAEVFAARFEDRVTVTTRVTTDEAGDYYVDSWTWELGGDE